MIDGPMPQKYNQICPKLEKIVPDNNCKFSSKSRLAKILDCKNIPLDIKKAVEMVEKNFKSDNLIDIFYGFSSSFGLGLEDNKVVRPLIVDNCKKIEDFLDTKSGLTRSQRKLTVDSSLQNSEYLLEIATLCDSKKLLTNSTTKALKNFANGLYSHTQTLNENQRGFIDGNNPVSTTANIIALLKNPSLFAPKFLGENLPQFIEFINEYNPDSYRELYYVAKFLKAVEKSVILELENDIVEFEEGKGIKIGTKLSKIGENSVFEKKDSIKINFILKNSEGKQLSVNAAMKQSKSTNNEIHFEGHLNKIEEFGNFYIELILSNDGKTIFTLTKKIRITKKSEPNDLKYDVAQSKTKPEILTQSLKYEEGMSRDISMANQNSFIFAELTLSDSSTEYAQVAMRLKHPAVQKVTNFVIADYNTKSRVYSVVFDLGDPDLILPISGIYYGEFVVADPSISKPIIWFKFSNSRNFARFNVTFKKEININELPQDSNYKIESDITHSFAPPEKQAHYIIIAGATFALVAVVFIFSVSLNYISVPNATGKSNIWTLLFPILIIGYVALLVVFWVKINLLQLVPILFVAAIPTLIICNKALEAIYHEDEPKQKEE